ncbi:MAG: hypothetical protein ACRDQ4_06630 [Pseudonocardiaceae bacterium]
MPFWRTRLRRMVSNPEGKTRCSRVSPSGSPRRAPVMKVSPVKYVLYPYWFLRSDAYSVAEPVHVVS